MIFTITIFQTLSVARSMYMYVWCYFFFTMCTCTELPHYLNSLVSATSAERQFLSISSCCVVYISLQPKTGLIWLGICLAAFWSSSRVAIHLSFSVSFSVRISTSLRTPMQAGWLQEIWENLRQITGAASQQESITCMSRWTEHYTSCTLNIAGMSLAPAWITSWEDTVDTMKFWSLMRKG